MKIASFDIEQRVTIKATKGRIVIEPADVGDVVWLEFDPQAGHRQAGHRPALVMSPALYNGNPA